MFLSLYCAQCVVVCVGFSQVPFFVQFHSKWRRLFAGISEYPGFRTSFEMVQLKNTPQQCANLTSLLNVFKSKIVRNLYFCTYMLHALFTFMQTEP